MEEGLHPKELVKSSFYLTDFYVLIDETFWREGLEFFNFFLYLRGGDMGKFVIFWVL